MPRPQPQEITFQIDGREVRAPENTMLADAAKLGDIEIPVFCYEPKLGQPVGACRMCLVEIEGMPKLQTACSTAVKDGMVVHTRSERAKVAQEAVVEFLLINHPLDCPVCDKGGECPLQDITFGWGGGTSRFIDPKRHFRKPLELSPLIAIDRERCILCYRCVRYSQEIAEDYQLVLLERGAHSFVGTFDGHPYVAPFSGNIIELCPVGALTSRPYRFRARPWDIEDAGSLCTLCPAQCNTTLTVRDERVLRVLERDHHEVDDGWLCDKGRFAYQAMHVDQRITSPMIRDGGVLREVDWDRALAEATGALRRAGAATAALAGGGATNEEGLVLGRLLRDVLRSPHLDSRAGNAVSLADWRALADPALAARVSDLEFAHAVLVLDCEPIDDAPILELRIRKGVRRNGVRLLVASERPSALDPRAEASLRFAPGRGAELAWALTAALRREPVEEAAHAAGVEVAAVRGLARALRSAGKEIVIFYGERLLDGDAGGLLALADALGLAKQTGAGLIGIPQAANGRGLREAGVLPDGGPGLSAAKLARGHDANAIARALAGGELTALYLLDVDPLRSHPDGALWEQALGHATSVIAHASFLTEGLREHATVIFPAETSAEKEGTVTHPDGRVQRLRPAVGHAGEVRSEWRVLADLAERLGTAIAPPTARALSEELFAEVAFYDGLTLEALAGRGVRWQELAGADALRSEHRPAKPKLRKAPRSVRGKLRLGDYRSIWAAPEVEASPALAFLTRKQWVELSPGDAQTLALRHDEAVVVADAEREVRARVVVRENAPAGTAFLERGLDEDGANRLRGPQVTIRSVASIEAEAAALAAEAQAAAEHESEAAPSEASIS
ncbi:MAG: NADH-quinone oxidoreductase subunit NuoG [Solirubrobacteraceae bacterium]|jgi:NADH-quinone oxidoreductase subunit G